jgi:hypothetical protein
MTTREQAIEYVSGIRTIQDLKHPDHTHTIPEWLLIIRRQLQKAEDAWYRGDSTEAFQRVGHVAACGLAAIEHNGHHTPSVASAGSYNPVLPPTRPGRNSRNLINDY